MATPQPKLRVLSDKGMVFTTRFAGAGRDTVITKSEGPQAPTKPS